MRYLNILPEGVRSIELIDMMKMIYRFLLQLFEVPLKYLVLTILKKKKRRLSRTSRGGKKKKKEKKEKKKKKILIKP